MPTISAIYDTEADLDPHAKALAESEREIQQFFVFVRSRPPRSAHPKMTNAIFNGRLARSLRKAQ